MWLRKLIGVIMAWFVPRAEKALADRLEAIERNAPREIYITVDTKIDDGEFLAEMAALYRNKYLALLLTQIREGYIAQTQEIKPGQINTDLINQLFGRISVIGEIQNVLAQKNAEYVISLRKAKTDNE